MGVNPRDFLESGRELVRQNREIDHRNGASRVYYAAFHACCILLNVLGIAFRRGGNSSHRNVAAALIQFSDSSKVVDRTDIKRVQRIGQAFSPLIKKRQRADYQIDALFPSNDAMGLLGSSRKIITEVERVITALRPPDNG